MSRKIIEVENLTKKYGEVTAVDGVSFEVFEGEIFSLVGPNGAGKTTIVEILECLRSPTSGTARVFGYDVTRGGEEIKKRIGVMPQEFNAFERLTVKENIELIARIYGTESSVAKCIENLGLWEFRNEKFMSLSGGMKKRVGVAMALASEPELLFLDEPTTGLDPQARKELWEIILNLKKMGVTVFLTTHYMEEVEALSDRASIILRGKLLSTGSVRELVSKYGGGIKVVVEGDEGSKALLETFAKEVSIDKRGRVVGTFEDRESVAEALSKLYKAPERWIVKVVEPSMEDVFLHVAGGRIDERGELIR